MSCEENMITTKTRSAFSAPHNTKEATLVKTQNNTGKTNKHCIVGTKKVTQLSQKPHETSSYACHMCGLNGHKMIDCLKFIEM
jgi:hypothetical protein